jgi:uncharacterized protein (DUF4415 family)
MQPIDVEKRVLAIESDAGPHGDGSRESLAQAKTRISAAVHTPVAIVNRRVRPVGSISDTPTEAVKLRLDADVLEALRSSGDGGQTRINDTLRAALALSGTLPPSRS